MSAGLSTEDLVAAEETAAGLRSPEMMVTGLNQHLVTNALNSELLDGSHQTRNTETTDKLLLLNIFFYFDLFSQIYLIFQIQVMILVFVNII